MVLRNRLKERRAALNVNQQEMGRLCGVSRQTISLIERGDYSPSVTLALTIAKVCGVAVEEIFYLQKEAEKLMIGKCAYKAYAAANTACAVLAITFAVCALIFNTGSCRLLLCA